MISKEQIKIIKDRERQRQLIVNEEWKQARKYFFESQTLNKLKEAGATQQQQQFIAKLFIQGRQVYYHSIKIERQELGQLQRFNNSISELQQLYCSMQECFVSKQRQCQILTEVNQHNYKALKAIHIEYEQLFERPKYTNKLPYSISAYQLLQIIHKNRQLTSVTLKGVHVQLFQQSIASLNPHDQSQQAQQHRQELDWMQVFSPPKELRLNIDAILQFNLCSIQHSVRSIENLVYFQKLIGELSEITIKIYVVKWSDLKVSLSTLDYLWRSVRVVKNLRIRIEKQGYQYLYYIPPEMVSGVRSILFGGLALQSIARLQLKCIHFSKDIIGFEAIEEIFRTISQQNTVTHLKLQRVTFPKFPSFTTLREIDLEKVNIAKQPRFLNNVTQANQQLKSIRLYDIKQKWEIDEYALNRLENLYLGFCNMPLNMLPSTVPLKIKYLCLNDTKCTFVTIIFPQLFELIYLYLSNIKISHQFICAIPSPHLQELHFTKNGLLIDKGLGEIDLKWPWLKNLTIRQCNLSQKAWNNCLFKGIMEMSVDSKMFETDGTVLSGFRSRGIKVGLIN